ncbi:MAG: hypothetical protein ACFFBP_18145 [Promethearchaeota archaeon]
MAGTIKGKFARILFLFGLALAFISMFMDWYYYSACSSGSVIAEWSFNAFLSWQTSFIEGISSNEALRPKDSTELLIMGVILIGLVFICAFGAILKSVEMTNSMEETKPYIYLNTFLLMINGYFILVMPFTFLITNELYFPFISIEDLSTNTIHSYCIGPAYVMQVASFLLIFPHILFSVLTINRFESKKRSPETLIAKILESSKEEIPLEKFIAELNSESRSKEDVSIIYEKFQRQRWRRTR